MFRSVDPEPTYEEVSAHTGEPRILRITNETDYLQYLTEAAVHKVRYDFELTGLLRR